ncbi:MAG: FN3 associated domain-containing protein, partial [Planctomycetota bacterium]
MPRAIKVFSLILVITMSLIVRVGAQSQLIGDLNSDYTVNIRDLQTFAWDWLSPGCLVFDCTANLDGVDGVNMADFAILANNWQVVEPRIIISEFMASNASDEPLEDGELLDGEGESSDWIEIYNPTNTTISLDGWYLTDDDDDLTKWQFPNGLEVKPGEFLLVFASEKTFELYPYNYPYLDADGYYHTNFNLDKDPGEYLALVADDGSTIVHEYASEYPTQLTNISYGLAQYAATLVPTGATATYHIPTSSDESLGSDWTTSDFDDSGWDSGPTGIGFGVSGITNENLEAYYEFEGNASDSSGNGNDGTLIGDVTFEIDPERGEVLSLPGGSNQYVQIGSVGISGNMPRTIACWAKADHTSIPDWTLIIGFTTLVGGCGSHFNIGSLGGPGGVGAHAWCWEETIFSDTEALDWHHYAMSYDGTTITYYGDGILMDTDPGNSNVIDLSIQADNVHIGSRITQDSSFPGKVDDACIYSKVLSDDEISMVMDGSTIETDVQSQMQNVNASLWTRIEFDIEEGEESLFDTLTLRMKYEDGFVAYLNGQKVAWGNAPDTVEWDSKALLDRPVEDSLVFEEFNLTAFLHVLEPGKNVLAIHGLNENKNDDELLFLPELVAARNRVVPEYFTKPTPGTFNISGAAGRVSDIWVSTEGTFYTGPPDWHIPLTLSTATDGAEIRYTLDGSRPTITHGLTFDTLTDPPLEIDKTTILRAVGVKPGWLDSKVETHTYLFPDDVIKQSPTGLPPGPDWPSYSVNGQVINYGMDPCIVNDPVYGGQLKDALKAIPTISLVTDLANLFDPLIGIYVNARQDGFEWERPVSVELLNPDGSEGFHVNAGLRIRGAFSRSGGNPKHSLRLFFRSVYGAGKLRYPLFGSEGVDEFDKIDLRTSQNNSWAFQGSSQNTLIRDVFSRDVQRDMGQPYARSRYYHLYINGHYWGLYQTEERADADFAESYLGGDKEEYDVVKNDSSSTRVLHATDGTMEAYRRLYDAAVAGFTSDAAYLAVQGFRPDGTPDPSGERLLDPENLMDYMICTYYTGDPDAPVSCWAHFSNNVFAIFNRVRPQGFTWYRHDAEHSLGANGGIYEGRLLTDPTDRSVGQDWEDFNPAWLHLRMTTNPEYLMQFADRVHKYFYNGGLLVAAPNIQRWMTRADQIDMPIIAESARWGDSKREPPRTKDDWEGQNNYMVNTFFPGRTQIVINQMRSVDMFPDLDAPVFNINGSYQHGGQVSVGDELTMDNPNSSGNIYYTLDGSNPRQAFSGNPIGTKYTHSITLNKTTHVKARVLDGGTWSALNEAIFAIGPVKEDLRITEIMYHPRYTGNINDPNEEFIELTNIGQDTLNINL